MEEDNSVYEFIAIVTTSMPHIAVNIIQELDPCDVANCLRTSKIFRHFIISTLGYDKKLKTDLNDKVPRWLLTCGSLIPRKFGPLKKGGSQWSSLKRRFGVGIDNILWLYRTTNVHDANYFYFGPVSRTGMLMIHDLQGKCKTKTPIDSFGSNLDINILPGRKILHGFQNQALIFTKTGENALEREEIPLPQPAYGGDDCVTTLIRNITGEEPSQWQMVFSQNDGIFMPRCALELKKRSSQLQERVRSILQQGNLSNVCDLFKTETFWGFVYFTYVERTATCEKGKFKLVVLDGSTDNKIYHGTCWKFCKTRHMLIQDMMPKVIAKGNYLIVCSKHDGGYGSDPKYPPSNTILCIKVDPESKACKVRKTHTGLEQVLLAKTLLDQDKSGLTTLANISPECRINFAYNSLQFLGFGFESVVVCQAKINYKEDNFTYFGAKVVLALDLDKILDMHEPANMFSAVHFPLKQNIFDCFMYHVHKDYPGNTIPTAKGPEPEFYPYYQMTDQEGKEQVSLSGIIEISAVAEDGSYYDYYCDDEGQMEFVPEIHSFVKTLEVKNLSLEMENKQPSTRKLIKLDENKGNLLL